MQLVTAIIRPHRLGDVTTALHEAGALGLTITEVSGFGRQGGKTAMFLGSEYVVDFLPKLKVEVVADVFEVDTIIAAITKAAATGRVGDGKIWVTEVDNLVRIRTGEQGTDAL